MKKNLLLIGFAILMAIPMTAESNDHKIISEERTVSAFDGIDINGRFKIILFESNQPKITVVATNDFISTIQTNVKNNTLEIKMMEASQSEKKGVIESLKAKYQDYLSKETIEIRIGVNNLKKLSIAGVSSYESASTLNSKTLYINASNASKGNLNIHVSEKLSVALSGAAKLTLKGTANKIQLDTNGASNLVADNFSTKDATVKQSGASRVQIVATESLDANLSGATKLVCKGSPKSVKQDTSRGSSITIE